MRKITIKFTRWITSSYWYDDLFRFSERWICLVFLEGNRREGRRPSYAFEYSSPPQIMPPPPPPPLPSTTMASTNSFLTSPLAHRSCKWIQMHLFFSFVISGVFSRSGFKSCSYGCRCCFIKSVFSCSCSSRFITWCEWNIVVNGSYVIFWWSSSPSAFNIFSNN